MTSQELWRDRKGLQLAAIALVLAAGTGSATVQAQTTGNNSIDWGVAGPARTSLGSSFNVVTQDSNEVTVSLGQGASLRSVGGPTASMQRLNQYNPTAGGRTWASTGWYGDFLPGEALLWSGAAAGPLTLDFGFAVYGLRTQIQSNAFGAFTAQLFAYDADGGLLTSQTRHAISGHGVNGSAPFIEVRSGAPIRRVMFQVDSLNPNTGFAINRVSIATPEPASLMLLAPGLLPLASLLRRRRRS